MSEYVSPGGFVFGVQGFEYAEQRPKSITFNLDGTVRVCDQYGRPIKGFVIDGEPVYLDRCTHAEAIAALTAERIDWLAYEVRSKKGGQVKTQGNMTRATAEKKRDALLKDGCEEVLVIRSLACAGWPQLPYKQLMEMPELPPTPLEELRKIKNRELRMDALKARREADADKAKELQLATEE